MWPLSIIGSHFAFPDILYDRTLDSNMVHSFPSLLGRAREGLLLLVFEVEHWIVVDNLAG